MQHSRYELGVNNPLRRLAPSRRRGIIWRMQALVAAYPAWQVCLVQRNKIRGEHGRLTNKNEQKAKT